MFNHGYRFMSHSTTISGRNMETGASWGPIQLASINIGSHEEANLILEMLDAKCATLKDGDPKKELLVEWMNGLRKTKDMARAKNWSW